MNNNFTTSLVAAASVISLASAQLPRHCFYVTELHGAHEESAELLSDLPTLMAMYKPGMELDSIVALQDQNKGNLVSGLQVNLKDPKYNTTLELPTIGTKTDNWTSSNINIGTQPDRISILSDKNSGICDVIIYKGHKTSHLNENSSDCQTELEGITETQLRLTEEAPLVGFHGMVDGSGIVSLGLILLDTEDQICLNSTNNADMSMYQGMNDFQKSKAVEEQISQVEKQRAKALEAILIYDSIVKAQQSKEDVMQQIKNLHQASSINLDDNIPASVGDLEDLLNRLAKYDSDDTPATRTELKVMFNKLTKHYEGPGSHMYSKQTLPITVKDLKSVYQHLAMVNGFRGNHFENRTDTSPATIADLVILLDKLSEHYAKGPGRLDIMDIDVLISLFGTMSEYYTFGDGAEIEGSFELFTIYDYMSEIFGKASDFNLDKTSVKKIYEKIERGEKIDRTFNGTHIEDFSDLTHLEKEKKDTKLNSLLNEMYKYEQIENESQEILSNQYDDFDGKIDELYEYIETNQERMDELESLIEAGQMDAKNVEDYETNALKEILGKIDWIDSSTLEPNALKKNGQMDWVDPSTLQPDALKKNGQMDWVDPSTLQPDALKKNGQMDWVDPSTLAPNALLQGGQMNAVDPSTLPPNALKQGGSIAPNALKQVEETVVEPAVETEQGKVDEATMEKMLYAFIALTVSALLVGTAIGAICIYCISNRYKKSQISRHNGIQQQDSGNRFISQTQTIGETQTPGLQSGVPRFGGAVKTSSIEDFSPDVLKRHMSKAEDEVVENVDDESPGSNSSSEEEKKDNMVQITEQCTQEDDDDIGQILSSRGLNYKAPQARRNTFQIKTNFLGKSLPGKSGDNIQK